VSRVLVLGHRGASAAAPENTHAAFRAALAAGADGVEFDVRFSSDGAPVVIHDASLARTGGRRVRVESLTLRQLQKFDVGVWFGSEFAGERIPALGDALETLASARMVNIEIKALGAHPERGLDAIAALAGGRGEGRLLVSSFSPAVVAAAGRRFGPARTGLLVRRTITGAAAAARRAGAGTIALSCRQAARRRRPFGAAGDPALWVYPVAQKREWDRALTLGAAVVIGDDPAMLLRHRDAAARRAPTL